MAVQQNIVVPIEKFQNLSGVKSEKKTHEAFFDYRDERKLKRFLNEQGKIIPRRVTGLSAKEQNILTKSVKWSRHLGIIPFVSEEIR